MPETHIQFEDIGALLRGKTRSDLLGEAAMSLDSLMHTPGGGLEAAGNEAAEHLRAMVQDEARFADRPTVHRVADTEVVNAVKEPVSIASAKSERNFDFYLLGFPFDLRPSGPWSFNELKVEVAFFTGPQEYRPKVHAIFPNLKMQEKLPATGLSQVSLEPSVDFEVKNRGAGAPGLDRTGLLVLFGILPQRLA